MNKENIEYWMAFVIFVGGLTLCYLVGIGKLNFVVDFILSLQSVK